MKKYVMRCAQGAMDARRRATLRLYTSASPATPQTRALSATRRDVGVWAHRYVASPSEGMALASVSRLALHPKRLSRTRISSW